MTTLRIVSLFNKDLRGMLQVAPDYIKPVRYDARKLQGLLGSQQMTSGLKRRLLPWLVNPVPRWSPWQIFLLPYTES